MEFLVIKNEYPSKCCKGTSDCGYSLLQCPYGKLELNHYITQDCPREAISKDQIYALCYICKNGCFLASSNEYCCKKCKANMENVESVDKIPEPKEVEDEIKQCQSCIDRGYSAVSVATRVWNNNYYCCDNCYKLLLDNLLSGIPSHFSEIITSEDVLDNRDKIFNFHHKAIVNFGIEELSNHLESIKVVLFTKRIEAEVVQVLIDKYRAKNRVSGEDKSLKESKKIPQSGSAGAKLLKSKQDKQIESLARTLGMSVEKYKELMGVARQEEFKGLLDGKIQSVESKKELELPEIKYPSQPEEPKEKICPLCSENLGIDGKLLAHYKVCEKRKK